MAEVSRNISDQRAQPRRALNILGKVRAEDTYFDGIILNVSDEGFGARLARELQVGSWVELSCEESSIRTAEVVWRNGGDHGFKFADAQSVKPAACAAEAPAVIWVDFSTLSIGNGPLFASRSRKYPGYVRLGLVLSLGSAAWMLVIAGTVTIAGLLR
jgi:hypothetical protein